jgi:hypothetical protein
MQGISDLLELLDRVCKGGEVTEQQIIAVRWMSPDPVVADVANSAWLALRRFSDDADIRARDSDYERSLRRGICAWHRELVALERGEDPNRRRASWLRRLLSHFGLLK